MTNKNVKVLVTGGAGYVGDATVEALTRFIKPENIHVVDKLIYTDSYMRPHVQFHNFDIVSDEFFEFIRKEAFDVIIHLAAIVGESACEVLSIDSFKINEVAVKNICNILKAHLPDTRFIFSSTCSVYGDNDADVHEESDTKPLGTYARSKLHAEEHVRSLKNYVIFRLATLFGMSTPFGRFRTDLVPNILTLRAVEGQKLVVIGGNQWRPLLHVRDAGKIFAEAANATFAGMYLLGNRNYTVLDIAQAVHTLVKSSGGIEVVEADMSELRNYRVDAKKAHSFGLLKNLLSLEEGVVEAAEHIRNGRIKSPWDIKYDNGKFIKHISNE